MHSLIRLAVVLARYPIEAQELDADIRELDETVQKLASLWEAEVDISESPAPIFSASWDDDGR